MKQIVHQAQFLLFLLLFGLQANAQLSGHFVNRFSEGGDEIEFFEKGTFRYAHHHVYFSDLGMGVYSITGDTLALNFKDFSDTIPNKISIQYLPSNNTDSIMVSLNVIDLKDSLPIEYNSVRIYTAHDSTPFSFSFSKEKGNKISISKEDLPAKFVSLQSIFLPYRFSIVEPNDCEAIVQKAFRHNGYLYGKEKKMKFLIHEIGEDHLTLKYNNLGLGPMMRFRKVEEKMDWY